ncbi:MAG: HAMP domain-containing sensor histidine kinase [Pseudomonadota bacterium]
MTDLPSSTAFRLAGYYSLAFTILIVCLGAAIYWGIRNELRYDLDQRIAVEQEAVLREGRASDLVSVVAARTQHGTGDMRYALFGPDGRSIAGGRMDQRPAAGWSNTTFHEDDNAADLTRALTVREAGGRWLVVGADPEALEELDAKMLPIFAVAFGLIVAIGVGGAFVLSRALSGRLDAINRTAEGIIGGDLAGRIALSGSNDEFDRLSATLNRMLDRITGLLGNLRQVTDDLAHDLRTPLTRMRQKLETGLARGEDAAGLRDAMEGALEQADGTLALFGAILDISEIEAGSGVRMAALDLSRLVTDLADSYRPSIEDEGREFRVTVAPDVSITGNWDLIAQVVSNLLDNALNHTPAGAAITIALGSDARLSVADSGPGIAPEDRARVFERFTRLEASRTTPGRGLGLALVAAVVRAHGGEVAIEDNQPGVRMMLSFPGAAAL